MFALFHRIIDQPWRTRVELETVESPKIKIHDLLDVQLFEELETTAKSELMRLGDRDAASLTLHLLLDSKVFLERGGVPPPKPLRPPKIPAGKRGRDKPSPPTFLPAALRPHGARALAYLKAGFHVLFAGAPGTGKTTLAQFVGYAWDSESAVLLNRAS